jgi:hypothetical protein
MLRSSLKRSILLIQVFLLSACSGLRPAASPIIPDQQSQIATLVASAVPDKTELLPSLTPPPQKSSPNIPHNSDLVAAPINPLTGLPAPEPNLLDRRPVMVKVSNYPVVGRPHAGLSFADLVFEYYIGEYMNRFLAVYYSQDAPKVGPVRSGRLIDAQLGRMYQGVLAYGSADERVDEVIKQYLGIRSLAHTESPCPPICGFDPHSAAGTFADTGSLTQYFTKIGVENTRQDLSGMVFNAKPPESDQMAVQVGVQYSNFNRGEWRYDSGTGKYLRWIEQMDDKNNMTMIPLVDRLTDKQLEFSNVVILYAFYIEYNRTLHNIDIWNNTTGKRAVYFRDGVMTEGLWKTIDKEHPIQLLDQDGKPYALKPGNTWIVIAGLSSTFEQRQPGQWEMYFYLP